jgi:hypothetical protein
MNKTSDTRNGIGSKLSEIENSKTILNSMMNVYKINDIHKCAKKCNFDFENIPMS